MFSPAALSQNGPPSKLRVTMQALPDTVGLGETVTLRGTVYNDGPGMHVIHPQDPLAHSRMDQLQANGGKSPQATAQYTQPIPMLMAPGDSLDYEVDQTFDAARVGGGGGLDILVIVWPARVSSPNLPKDDKETGRDTTFVRSTLAPNAVTSLDSERRTDLRLSPNPARHQAHLHSDQPWSGRITLHSLQGQVVRQWQVEQQQDLTLDLREIAPGWYSLQVQRGQARRTLRLVIID